MKTMKMLVIDHMFELEPLFNQTFAERIQLKKFKFFFVSDASDALKQLEVMPDIVVSFSYLTMPQMDGLMLLTRLKERSPRLCPIILASPDDIRLIKTAMRQGAHDFLLTPLDGNELDHTLVNALRYFTARDQRNAALDKVRKAFAREQDLLRTLANVLPDIIYVKDTEGRFLRINDASKRALGDPDAVLGKTDFDFFPAELAEQYAADERNIVQSGQPLINQMERSLNLGTGETRWVLTTKIPYRDYRNNIIGVVGINRDITELKQLNDALQASEQQYRLLIERVGDGIAIIQGEKIVFMNEAFCSIFHDTADRLLQTEPFTLLQEKKIHSDTENNISPEIKDTESSWHVRHTTRDGRELWIETQQSAIQWESKPALLITVRDITKRKCDEILKEKEKARLHNENLALKATMKNRNRFGNIIGRSSVMQHVYELILKAAEVETPVMILGESGTGKELIAQTIHQLSNRTGHNFISVNCGAIPEALFESEFFGHRKGAFTGAYADKPGFFDAAQQGTLFLDEVGELSLPLQVKLLRALEYGEYAPVGSYKTKRVNVRIIAATNRNMLKQVKEGNIREDFFYRLHVIEIMVPPLRERQEDMPILIEHFLKHFAQKPQQKISDEILGKLYAYEWPGNIRELQNVLCRYITTHHLSFANTNDPETDIFQSDQPLRVALEEFERQYILDTLRQYQWHRGKAANALEIPERTLYRKLKKYQLI